MVPLPAALGEEDGPDSSEVPSVGLTSACMSHPHYGDICSPGSSLSPTGEWRLTAASRPLRCSWYPAHYMAPADMLHKDGAWQKTPPISAQHLESQQHRMGPHACSTRRPTHHRQDTPSGTFSMRTTCVCTLQHPQPASKLPLLPCSNAAGTPWSCCPRSTLKRALQQLQDKHKLRLMVGFELEFILLRRAQEGTSSSSSSSDSWREVDQSQYCHSGALDSSAAGGWGGSCGEASVDVRLRAVSAVAAVQCML